MEFWFFLKNPITKPHSVSIWIILNDLKFRIDVSCNSVNTLIRLRSHFDAEKKPLIFIIKIICIYVLGSVSPGSFLHWVIFTLHVSCFLRLLPSVSLLSLNGTVSLMMITCFFNFCFYSFPFLICSFVWKCHWRYQSVFLAQHAPLKKILITLFLNSHFTEYLVRGEINLSKFTSPLP